MNSVLNGKALLFGLLLWVIPFFAAFPLFPLKEKRPLVFKAAMSVVLAGATAALARFYLAGHRDRSTTDGILLGMLCAGMCIVIDLPIFLAGFKMKPAVYFSEIGLCYLAVPVITWSMAGLMSSFLAKS